ncbi:hypothetical protein [Endothiovibrio diazotrophicus]
MTHTPGSRRRPASIGLVLLLALLLAAGEAHAERRYSPNDVYSGVEYANGLLDRILAKRGTAVGELPRSREENAKPMHVYELHVAALAELYEYALANDRRPPPLALSTPIEYTPTDVYRLTRLVFEELEEIYRDGGDFIDFAPRPHHGKSPADVLQAMLELYYKLDLLNGRNQVSPSEVYAHIRRAREDLQSTLLALSKRLPEDAEGKKRQLVTAIYGMNPDGTALSPREEGKKPADALNEALAIRTRLNELRKRYGLPEITPPAVADFATVKPIDVFLQTQFIIAELNLLKVPMEIHTTTNTTKPASGKTPSDVVREMKHIQYMLDRVIAVQ